MDFDVIDLLAPLALIVLFVGNELGFALAAESYGMAYIPMRVAVIPACSGLLVVGSLVRWWNARDGSGERSQRAPRHLAGVVVGVRGVRVPVVVRFNIAFASLTAAVVLFDYPLFATLDLIPFVWLVAPLRGRWRSR